MNNLENEIGNLINPDDIVKNIANMMSVDASKSTTLSDSEVKMTEMKFIFKLHKVLRSGTNLNEFFEKRWVSDYMDTFLNKDDIISHIQQIKDEGTKLPEFINHICNKITGEIDGDIESYISSFWIQKDPSIRESIRSIFTDTENASTHINSIAKNYVNKIFGNKYEDSIMKCISQTSETLIKPAINKIKESDESVRNLTTDPNADIMDIFAKFSLHSDIVSFLIELMLTKEPHKFTKDDITYIIANSNKWVDIKLSYIESLGLFELLDIKYRKDDISIEHEGEFIIIDNLRKYKDDIEYLSLWESLLPTDSLHSIRNFIIKCKQDLSEISSHDNFNSENSSICKDVISQCADAVKQCEDAVKQCSIAISQIQHPAVTNNDTKNIKPTSSGDCILS